MLESGKKSNKAGPETAGIKKVKEAHWNLQPTALVEEAIKNGEGRLTDTGALMCDTGKFTGRSPKDRYIVRDESTEDKVWWGDINIGISPESLDRNYTKMLGYLEDKKVYVRDAFAGADKTHRLKLRVINTMSWHNMFAYFMFIRPEE